MAITVSCPSCRATGQVPDEALGHQVTCPVCHTAFVLDKPNTGPPTTDILGVWVDSAPPSSRATAPATPVVMPPAPAAVTPPPSRSLAPAPVSTAPAAPEALVAPPPAAAAEPAPPPKADPEFPVEWAKSERERFDAHVADGLARLAQARRENSEAESRHEAACINRSVELSRQFAVLTERMSDIDRREGDLRLTAESLAAREGEFASREAQLADREAALAARESRHESLQSEAAELAKLIAELRPVVEGLELRKVEAESLRAEIAAKQSALDRRLISVGRSELAVQKRMAELDEMEQALRAELEEREAELERQRSTLMEEVRTLRERSSVNTTPMPRSPLPPSLPPRVTQEASD